MLILAVETATLNGSVALVEGSWGEGRPGDEARILGEHGLNLGSTDSERLMPAIDSLLQETSRSIAEVQGIALSLGPGSFTGLRIGVATVKGLAYARGIPVAGVSTLEGLAANAAFSSAVICPVLDARKKEVYAALFRVNEGGRLERLGPDWVLSPEDLCRRISEKTIFLGNGMEVYGELFKERLGSLALLAPSELFLPRAANIARLSLPRFKKGLALDLFTFAPIYVRRPEAEIHFESKEQKKLSPQAS